MSEPDRRAFGGEAEDLAVQHLERAGYKIRDRNVPCRVGELDVVAELGDLLVIVEVRMRSHDGAGDPMETVMSVKRHRVAMATLYYLQQERIERDIRFDVISIIGRGKRAVIEHIEGAFDAEF
jgi:putative endonuclease